MWQLREIFSYVLLIIVLCRYKVDKFEDMNVPKLWYEVLFIVNTEMAIDKHLFRLVFE
jgi:hypothetical protein